MIVAGLHYVTVKPKDWGWGTVVDIENRGDCALMRSGIVWIRRCRDHDAQRPTNDGTHNEVKAARGFVLWPFIVVTTIKYVWRTAYSHDK